MRKLLCAMATVLLLHHGAPVPEASAAMAVPPDFRLVRARLGAALYARLRETRAEYVQVVDLRLGASVELLRGPVADPGIGLGPYGGDNPTFRRARLGGFWSGFLSAGSPSPFSVMTGAFFDRTQAPAAPLRLPLREGGTIVTEGWEGTAFDGGKALLEVGGAWARIAPLTPEALAGSVAARAVAGLAVPPEPPPGPRARRVLAGVRDPDDDGAPDVLLLYAGSGVTLAEAAGALRGFFATSVVELNEGGAQLLVKGTTYLGPGKSFPQALAVRAAPSTPAGWHLAEHRIVRAGNCTINGRDDYAMSTTHFLERRRRGLRFDTAAASDVSVSWSGADKGSVRVRLGVNCGGTMEYHTARSTATIEPGVIRIAPYRMTWCEKYGCVFDESWTLTPTEDPCGVSALDAAEDAGCLGGDCDPPSR